MLQKSKYSSLIKPSVSTSSNHVTFFCVMKDGTVNAENPLPCRKKTNNPNCAQQFPEESMLSLASSESSRAVGVKIHT